MSRPAHTNDAIDAWLVTLVIHGLVTAAWNMPHGGWLVQNHADDAPQFLPHAEAALAFITESQHTFRTARRRKAGA